MAVESYRVTDMATRNPKFTNGDGTLTRYALLCGYAETHKGIGRLGATVTLWREHDHYHIRRDDWPLVRSISGHGTPGWDTIPCSDGIAKARKIVSKLRRGFQPIDAEKIGWVNSSHGKFVICMTTGAVIEWHPDLTEGKDTFGKMVLCFDLGEYFRHYSKESRDDVREFDVLDLGYVCVDGTYEPPVQEFRDAVAENCATAM